MWSGCGCFGETLGVDVGRSGRVGMMLHLGEVPVMSNAGKRR